MTLTCIEFPLAGPGISVPSFFSFVATVFQPLAPMIVCFHCSRHRVTEGVGRFHPFSNCLCARLASSIAAAHMSGVVSLA